jgi:hypothetical protein
VTAKVSSKETDGKEGEVTISKELGLLSTVINSKHIEGLALLAGEVMVEGRKELASIMKGVLKIIRNVLEGFLVLRRLRGSARVKEEEVVYIKELVEGC